MKTHGIRFIVTSLCNYDCVYCHNEWEPKEKELTTLETDLIKELIFSCKELGGKEVDLTGGEPLLRIDKVEFIIKTATTLELWTNLTTNGSLLDKYGERLIQAGLKEIHIHIPSLNSLRYNELMRRNSDLNKILKIIADYARKFPVIKANIPIICGKNDDEIPEMIKFFNSKGITPRFIESMSTSSYKAPEQRIFENVIREHLPNFTLKNSYLWGINEYESELGSFETLRCICFDRKCDICPENNFIHVDQNYKIRPCNLRPFKIQAEKNNTAESLNKALEFLNKQTDIPEEYKKMWGEEHIPIRITARDKK